MLKTTYGFTCRCIRCVSDEKLQSSIPPAPEDTAVFVDLYPALIRFAFGAYPVVFKELEELPERCREPLPQELLPLKVDAHLPFLSGRFRDAAHDGDHKLAEESGLALLALYLTIYPVAYPLIGTIQFEAPYYARSLLIPFMCLLPFSSAPA